MTLKEQIKKIDYKAILCVGILTPALYYLMNVQSFYGMTTASIPMYEITFCAFTSLALYMLYKYKTYKSILFVVLSSQLLYWLINLLGRTDYLPKAGIAVPDMFFYLFVGIALYFLYNGSKKLYFIGFAVILWPTFILQYFFIKIFDKPFLLSELINFWTLIQVSTPLLKLWYGGLFVLWSSGVVYLLAKVVIDWRVIKTYAKVFALATVCFYNYLFNEKVVIGFTWDLVAYQDNFNVWGVISTIKRHYVEYDIDLTPESVQHSFTYLKEIEKNRTEYPISQSPKVAPEKKRPIFVIVFEAFYDFREFEEYFDEDPFPKEYRDMVSTYSGPNQTYGSFPARVTSLTGGTYLTPSTKSREYSEILPNVLKKYGYTSFALESVSPTYGLQVYYKKWNIESRFSLMFGGTDDPYNYERNVMEIINNTPDDVVPFYFGFTYLGHSGSTSFADELEDPKVDISRYLELFENKTLAKRLLKSGIFNAQRMISFRDGILTKYPDALIVYRSDHMSIEHYEIFDNPKNTLSKDFVSDFRRNPHVLPYIVIDGTNGVMKLREGFSPENTALLVLAESGLPYEGTAISLLYRSVPKDMSSIYGRWYKRNGDKYVATDMTAQMTEYNKALETISTDLYQNRKTPLTLELLKK